MGNLNSFSGKFAAVALVTFISLPAHAEGVRSTLSNNTSAGEAATIQGFSASLVGQAQYRKNVFLQDQGDTDSVISVLAGGLAYVAKPSRHTLRLYYTTIVAGYAESSRDNFNDHNFGFDALLDLNTRNQLDISTSLLLSTEDRGDGISEQLDDADPLFPVEPDEFRTAAVDMAYTFGAPGNRGRLVLDSKFADLEYQNNRARTQIFDYTKTGFGATIFLRMLSNTDFLIEARASDYDYNNPFVLDPNAPSDSRTKTYRVGVQWDATAKTSGTVRFGVQEKDFDAPQISDSSDFNWLINLDWAPRTYSTFNFGLQRSAEESTGSGVFIDEKVSTVAWNHEWNSRWNTVVRGAHIRQTFSGSNRRDTQNDLGARGNYQFNQDLVLFFGIENSNRNSTFDNLSFNDEIYSIGFGLSL